MHHTPTVPDGAPRKPLRSPLRRAPAIVGLLALFFLLIVAVFEPHLPRQASTKRPPVVSQVSFAPPVVPRGPSHLEDKEKDKDNNGGKNEGKNEDNGNDKEKNKDKDVHNKELLSPKAAARIMADMARAHGLTGEGKVHCLIYDRPPRTGSSTTSFALQACIAHLGFAEPAYKFSQESNAQIGRLATTVSGVLRALVTKHIRIVESDSRTLRRTCGSMLYLTNCRPMRERLFSREKFQQQLRAANVSAINHLNGSLSDEQTEEALQRIGRDNHERSLEFYPYIGVDNRPAEVEEKDRFTADYVVRNGPEGEFTEDLQRLLEALGCGRNFTTSNIHAGNGVDESEALKDVELRYGDELYKRLKRIGDEGNEEGLVRVRAFAQIAASAAKAAVEGADEAEAVGSEDEE